ncbi:MAG: hypothetical protein KGL39_52280 [Patescibacteria group bacterium]|nr:hypothetical protein [Patescibacteria group bacterium]
MTAQHPFVWTRDLLARAERMIADGWSQRSVALVLGCTKNMISGHSYRRGWRKNASGSTRRVPPRSAELAP